MAHNTHFDGKYYSRFYGKGGVHGKKRIADLATSVHHMCKWWGLDVRSVLDIGAGPGFWSNWYRAEHPRVLVHSTDVSDHACKKYGHEQRDISKWIPPRSYDLVICHGVLQYPGDAAAKKAIEHLGVATKHILYLEIPTTNDFANVVDVATTDMDVHQRSGVWYRRELNKSFQQVGAGLWLSRQSNIPMYELEQCASR